LDGNLYSRSLASIRGLKKCSGLSGLGEIMESKITKTRKYRLDMNEKILNSGFKDFQKFFALDNKAYLDGKIPVKYKELMGLVGSMVLRCNDCIFYHLDRCVTEGATREELHEAMNIALIIGGSIVIPHLRYAFEVMEELQRAEGGGQSA
jgi:AhpD family alkylhydroperoxidase